MEEYKNRDGVVVSAELVTEGEHTGFWHIVDANGVEGYATDEQFQRNFSATTTVPAAPTSDTTSQSGSN